MSWNPWAAIHAQQAEISRLAERVQELQTQVREMDRINRTEAEMRAEGETMALRKLIRDLVGGKPNIDRFLDVLSDYSHLFEAGPLEGDIEKVMAGARPQPGDRGEPLPEGTPVRIVSEDAYAKDRT